MIKLLLSSLLLAMLTACVSPYYAARDADQGSYEAAAPAPSQDAYYDEEYDASPDYYDAGYYPWWSVDYFYLGRPYYRPSYGSSFSFSLSSGYPYYDPFYYPGYYSAWYTPYYYDPWFGAYYGWGGGYGRYDPYWRRGYGRQHHRSPRRGDFHGHDRGHERVGSNAGAGRSPGGFRRGDNQAIRDRRSHTGYRRGGDQAIRDRRSHTGYRRGGDQAIRDRRSQADYRRDAGRTEPAQTSRNVLVAPSRGRRDRGMVIDNRRDSKPRPYRPQPVGRRRSPDAVMPQSPANPRAVTPYRSGQPRGAAPDNRRVTRSRSGPPRRYTSPEPAAGRGNRGVQSRYAAPPPAASFQRSNRQPVTRPAGNNSNSYQQAPRDPGNDGGGPRRDSGDGSHRGGRKRYQ